MSLENHTSGVSHPEFWATHPESIKLKKKKKKKKKSFITNISWKSKAKADPSKCLKRKMEFSVPK